MTIQLHESSPFSVAAQPSTAEGQGRIAVTLMTPGWGSSGYYGSDVVEAAGTDRVFPAGTHMYVNHPSATESYDRPERDVSTLAAVLLEDGRWDGAKLVSEAVVFSNWRQPLSEMAPYIGVSIRGSAEVAEGEAEGRRGRIVTRLTEGASVDFVTRAGRGGEFNVLESDHIQVVEAAWAAGTSATVKEASANDSRDRISDLVRVEHYSDVDDSRVWVWVRDFDPQTQTVWFELEGAVNGIYQQAYTTDGAGLPASLEGTRTEVTIRTEYVPVTPAGLSNTHESEEDPMPQIEEARLRQLEADASRATAVEAQLAEARAQSEKDQATLTTTQALLAEARTTANTATATRIVNEAFTEALVTAPATAALVARNAPLTEAGIVDEEALKIAAQEAAAEMAAAGGAGKVRGLGAAQESKTSEDLSEAELDRELAKLSGRTVKEG